MLTFDSVTKRYSRADAPALHEVCLDVRRSEFVFVVGPSGSGKSTLMRLAIREELPTAGQVHVAGRALGSLTRRGVPALRRDLGMVFQDFRLLPDRTVAQNVSYAMEVVGAGRREVRHRVPEALEMVGLAGKAARRPHELSGGEQQRAALARAVANRPVLLLADEPTGNLDPDTSHEIVSLLARINHGGTTVVMATHDTSIVDAFRRRVVRLEAGRIVRDEAEGAYA